MSDEGFDTTELQLFETAERIDSRKEKWDEVLTITLIYVKEEYVRRYIIYTNKVEVKKNKSIIVVVSCLDFFLK